MTEITQADREIEITAADREAANAWVRGMPLGLKLTLSNPQRLYAAFAQHRTQARNAALEEAIAWCEGAGFPADEGNPIKMAIVMGGKQALANAATAIRTLITEGEAR